MLKIISVDVLDSTQLYLKEKILSKELVPPVAISAQLQTDGIGSRGNGWNSYSGNLFLSFALPLQDLPNDLKLESASIYFSFILKETLANFGSKVWIKWPNDFYIEEKKIGGMITNIVGKNLLCGVGINLIQAPVEFNTLDIKIDKKKLLQEYFRNIEKKVLWKQVFSKYKLEFEDKKSFSTHINGIKMSLESAILGDDGSLIINGERIYSLR
ncbi:biotin--[acetyl-CoA-carboxylase] ligase [Sulfurimonas sp.]